MANMGTEFSATSLAIIASNFWYFLHGTLCLMTILSAVRLAGLYEDELKDPFNPAFPIVGSVTYPP